jgi:hypothetical protein
MLSRSVASFSLAPLSSRRTINELYTSPEKSSPSHRDTHTTSRSGQTARACSLVVNTRKSEPSAAWLSSGSRGRNDQTSPCRPSLDARGRRSTASNARSRHENPRDCTKAKTDSVSSAYAKNYPEQTRSRAEGEGEIIHLQGHGNIGLDALLSA